MLNPEGKLSGQKKKMEWSEVFVVLLLLTLNSIDRFIVLLFSRAQNQSSRMKGRNSHSNAEQVNPNGEIRWMDVV